MESVCDLWIRVQPRASRAEIVGFVDGPQGPELKLRVTAPPVDGEANAAVVALLAKALGLPKGCVEIVTGSTGRRKRLRVHGLALEAIRARLE